MNLRSEMILDAKLIMRDGLMRIRPEVQIDRKGFVNDWEQNLLPDISPDTIEADLGGKGGSELERKFKAAHSSAALVVNSFAYFREKQQPLPIPGLPQLELDGFEKLFPTGLNRIPPHLDATASSGELLVAIESKCLEYFTPKVAQFAEDYFEKIIDERRQGPWFAEMVRLRDQPRDYEYLDAAQLIKHAFGLAWTVKERPTTLVYIFWEPADARYHRMFAEHCKEIAAFATGFREDGRMISLLEPLYGVHDYRILQIPSHVGIVPCSSNVRNGSKADIRLTSAMGGKRTLRFPLGPPHQVA